MPDAREAITSTADTNCKTRLQIDFAKMQQYSECKTAEENIITLVLNAVTLKEAWLFVRQMIANGDPLSAMG